ncbi:MAG TPA: UDP-N-acetylmuramate dehydrogenase [Acidimicrobiales bacterium]|nr:UDP-N-acetylmuramate dehydrogenase [Acidimicrobiales bacterium]
MSALDDVAAQLGDRAKRSVPIGPMTTYRVGGAAALLVTIDDEGDLAAVAAGVRGSGVAVLVVGKGSNLLVADRGFDGVAVVLGAGFEHVEIEGTTARAGGAAALPVVARRTVATGLTGFEWAVGVPGSIGGAVRMNAGGHGSDMAASLARVRVVDVANGDDGWMAASGLALGYRRSSIAPTQVVVEAELRLARGDRAQAEAEIADIVRWRRENQPGGQNAGSVFANPDGDSAGRLIDASGCKGLRVGTAVVSDKHANFFIADAGGRADDVHELMTVVQQRVLAVHGVRLDPETRLVGFDGHEPRLEVEG